MNWYLGKETQVLSDQELDDRYKQLNKEFQSLKIDCEKELSDVDAMLALEEEEEEIETPTETLRNMNVHEYTQLLRRKIAELPSTSLKKDIEKIRIALYECETEYGKRLDRYREEVSK